MPIEECEKRWGGGGGEMNEWQGVFATLYTLGSNLCTCVQDNDYNR